MSESASQASGGVLIHRSGLYDAFFGRFIRRTDEAILDLAGLQAGDRLLDVGTGPGYLARAAAPRVGVGGRAVGLDASPEMIKRAKSEAGKEGSNAEFVIGSAGMLPFPDGSFDVVVSRLVVHHLAGLKEQALEEMVRVLTPGGRLVVADFGGAGPNALHHALARLHGNDVPRPFSLSEGIRGLGLVEIGEGRLGRRLSYVKGRKPPTD